MIRKRALQVLLVVVGLALLFLIYPLVMSFVHPGGVIPADQMILGIYFPIGIFLLLAAREPSAHRSLIACFAWSTLAHDAVMVVQAVQGGSLREDGPPQVLIAIVCIALLALLPARPPGSRAVAAVS